MDEKNKATNIVTPNVPPVTNSNNSKLIIGIIIGSIIASITTIAIERFVFKSQLPGQNQIVVTPTPTSPGVICTMDAKLCPDGSYVGRQGPRCEFSPCPETTVLPTFNPIKNSPTVSSSNWNTYTYPLDQGILSMKKFNLSYPGSWVLKEKIRTEEPQSLSVTLTKNNAEITIMQGTGGGGGCLFPSDPDKDGMYSRYKSYKEINKNSVIWRRAESNDVVGSYDVCQSGGGDFFAHTVIGWISLSNKNYDAGILQEFDGILQKIEILN